MPQNRWVETLRLPPQTRLIPNSAPRSSAEQKSCKAPGASRLGAVVCTLVVVMASAVGCQVLWSQVIQQSLDLSSIGT